MFILLASILFYTVFMYMALKRRQLMHAAVVAQRRRRMNRGG